MDQEEYGDLLVERLRRLASCWIQTLQQPHPTYPFPAEFPFSETPMQATFDWNEFYDVELRHYYPVELVFTRIPPDRDDNASTRFIWKVISPNDNITLGFFELDSRIYFDDARLFPVDKSLILDAMLLSLRLGSYLELSSSVFAEEPGLVNVHCRDGADRNIEIFEIRTLSNRVVVRELGRRWIEKRRCSGCSCWIPPTGPGLCLEHIFN